MKSFFKKLKGSLGNGQKLSNKIAEHFPPKRKVFRNYFLRRED